MSDSTLLLDNKLKQSIVAVLIAALSALGGVTAANSNQDNTDFITKQDLTEHSMRVHPGAATLDEFHDLRNLVLRSMESNAALRAQVEILLRRVEQWDNYSQ